METALSVNGIPIRLTGERWMHITSGHPEMASFFFEVLETIEQPVAIFEGTFEEKIAVGIIRDYPPKHIVVVYREIGTDDGFVITAYLSDRKQPFTNRKKLWERKP